MTSGKIYSKKSGDEKSGPDFRPFRAWRYNPREVNLARVIAPPYDVISPDEQEALYQKSPFNVVRLILGKETNFYEEARRRWEAWSQQGILKRDNESAYYLYEQRFRHPAGSEKLRRLAVVGTLKLETSAGVLPHEATFAGPKRDRFLLLEKTHCNLSPIFGLIPDSNRLLPEFLSAYEKKPPLFEAADDDGVLHRGWAIEGEREQERIHEWAGREKILIADGHHRYETALEYCRQVRRKSPAAPAEAPYDFVMTALVGFEDQGLLVLPTHRIIRSFGSASKKDFLTRLKDSFILLTVSPNQLMEILNEASREEKVFGVVLGVEGNYLARLKSLESVRNRLPSGKPSVWYEIEANLLNHFVFDKVWGLPEEERRDLIEYTRSEAEAIQRVLEKKADGVLLLRSPEIGSIRKLAGTGAKMPQKTTYFYPKLASGLFFYSHEA